MADTTRSTIELVPTEIRQQIITSLLCPTQHEGAILSQKDIHHKFQGALSLAIASPRIAHDVEDVALRGMSCIWPKSSKVARDMESLITSIDQNKNTKAPIVGAWWHVKGRFSWNNWDTLMLMACVWSEAEKLMRGLETVQDLRLAMSEESSDEDQFSYDYPTDEVDQYVDDDQTVIDDDSDGEGLALKRYWSSSPEESIVRRYQSCTSLTY